MAFSIQSIMAKTLNDSLSEIMEQWAIEFIEFRIQDAKKIGQATGKGIRSFSHQVIRESANEAAKALFEFEGYLRYSDMKRMKWTSQAPVQEFIDWVKNKGVEKFRDKFIKKYGIPSSDLQMMNRIAWGIAKKRSKSNFKRKRIRWYSKNREKSISILYRRLLDAASEFTISNIKQNIKL